MPPLSQPSRSVLGSALVTLGLLTQRQLDTAISHGPDRPLGAVLLEHHLLDEATLRDVEALVLDHQNARTGREIPVERSLLGLIPADFALRRHVLPLRMVGKQLVVAYPDALARTIEETRLLDHLSSLTGHRVLGWPMDEEQLGLACRRFYDEHHARDAMQKALEVDPQADTAAADAWERAETDAPVAELVNQLLSMTIESRASDLHVDPQAEALIARIRVDGVLRDMMTMPRQLKGPVVNRIKLMAQLNITDHRLPQDGRFTFTIGDHSHDIRVAVAPTRWGEMAVLRVLRPLAAVSGLGELGLLPDDQARFKRMLASPHGIVLVTGPTGSGKSSTLYTALQSFDRVENHVVTIEDPVEYTIDRALQIQVNPKVGLTFAAALRSILRLDPNIILVGEIRDHETLQIAMDAAMTGHLVLSTLHTNDAVASFARMAELGASPQRVASTVVGIVAQRLARKLCEHCRSPYNASPEECRLLHWSGPTPPTLYQPVGCEACGNTGFKGRIALFELLEVTEAIGEALSEKRSPYSIADLAQRAGMTSLADDGRAKVLSGITTYKEVARKVREAPRRPDATTGPRS